jgi:uncharacterized protein (DUF1800 family)
MKITRDEASRFLMQASIGASKEDIEHLSNIGKESWLKEQFEMSMSDSCQDKTDEIWNYFVKALSDKHGKSNVVGYEQVLPYWFYWRMSWWDTALRTKETLRHKIAIALSEILVISDKSVLELNAYGLSNYYDMLYKHAFGNYEELLYDMSMHPCMGVYLSHMNNPKENRAKNIHPDENFAREIMQLFTIGLYELNKDGSKKLDSNNRPIATYDNDDIKEVAKVFTGLGPGKYWWPWEDYGSYDVVWANEYNKLPTIDATVPMMAFDEWHDKSEKTILKKHKISSGGDTITDIKKAINILFNEQNCAVFVSKKLIQHLTTSNPSKRYIKDVVSVFEDNGKGKRGDLQAVVTAILLHKEASSGTKMKEPMLRATQILRAFGASNESDRLWGSGFVLEDSIRQHPLSAPSVFNFFQSDYSPHGEIKKSGLVAPEFGMMDSATSIAYVNLMYQWFFGEYYMMVSTVASEYRVDAPEFEDTTKHKKEDTIKLNLSYEESLAKNDIPKLVEHLGLVLTGGALHKDTLADIQEAVKHYKDNPKWVVQTALFMITVSPDFTIISES